MILTTKYQIDGFRFSLLIQSYVTEIATGLKTSRIPLSRVAAEYGVTTRNKKKALAELLEIYEATYGKSYEDYRLARIFG